MRWFCIHKGMKGVKKLNDLYLRNEYTITDVARRRAEIVDFFNEFGDKPTKKAFGVSRSTVYRWKDSLKIYSGRLDALNNASRAPKNTRKSTIDPKIIEFIRETRKKYRKSHKVKLKPWVDEFCINNGFSTISESTIGRIIGRFDMFFSIKKKKRTNRKGRTSKIRRGKYQPQKPGDLLQIDTVVKFDFGIRRYVITAIDIVSRFTFAYGYTNPSSLNAADFMKKLDRVAPFKINRVQTDNGSEFDKHFHDYVISSNRIHYHNYPKSPKMNAFVERFNLTIQNEFIDEEDVDPYNDLESFNDRLMNYLLFYNTKRCHEGINKITPMAFIIQLLYKNHKKSNMYWTCT